MSACINVSAGVPGSEMYCLFVSVIIASVELLIVEAIIKPVLSV